MSIDKSEQWLLDGKSTMCRKKNYCSKPCRAGKDRRKYEMCCAVFGVLYKTMTEGNMNDLMNRNVKRENKKASLEMLGLEK